MRFDAIGGGGAPLTAAGVATAVSKLGINSAALWALVSVETRSCGFFADRRPQVLFERHIFHKRTGGQFDATDSSISDPTRGGYSGGVAEYVRLARAMALDNQAALESASWGLGQVMGFNATGLGYADVDDMVQQFCAGEDAQLVGVTRFIAGNAALLKALQSSNWAQVAFFYNGRAYADHQYDVHLKQYFDLYQTGVAPDLDIRAVQMRLTYLGFDPRGVDGVYGHGTQAAVLAFQQAHQLPATGVVDPATATLLKMTAGL